MTKTLARLGVAVGDLEAGIGLGAIVVSKLDDTFTIAPVSVGGYAVGRVICEEIQVEFIVWEFELLDLFHAKELVELH